jgi:hypothetical protein
MEHPDCSGVQKFVDVSENDAICILEAVDGPVEGSPGFLVVCVSFRLVDTVKGFEASLEFIFEVFFSPGLCCSSKGALVAEKEKRICAFDFEGSVDLSAVQSSV